MASVKEQVADLGVCEQHRQRMKRDEDYREAALNVHPDSPVSTGKSLKSTEPLKLRSLESSG
jgi:hypothetical protein